MAWPSAAPPVLVTAQIRGCRPDPRRDAVDRPGRPAHSGASRGIAGARSDSAAAQSPQPLVIVSSRHSVGGGRPAAVAPTPPAHRGAAAEQPGIWVDPTAPAGRSTATGGSAGSADPAGHSYWCHAASGLDPAATGSGAAGALFPLAAVPRRTDLEQPRANHSPRPSLRAG